MSIRPILVSILLLTAVCTACFGDLLEPGGGDLRILPDSLVLLLSDSTTLQAKYEGSDRALDPRSVEWQSYGEAIASIVGAGRVLGVETGNTAIAVRREDAFAIAPVTVIELELDLVTAGRLHSCAWAVGGAAYCWGHNSHGQLGSDAGANKCGEARCSFRPVAVEGGVRFSVMAAGGEHTCGLTTAGAAYCWGRNIEGQLGTGASSNGDHPDPAPVAGGHTFRELTTGRNHTCALTPASAAYCWGDNSEGQLGTGDRSSSASPVTVAGGLRFDALAAGESHTCGITGSGAAYCWGANEQHQLGTESGGSVAAPVRVSGDRPFETITAGDYHTCGLTPDGAAYCWGGNSRGQLGTGSRDSSTSEPSAVQRNFDYVAISAGGTHTCGAIRGGGVACWGWNGYRQIGDNAGLMRRSAPIHSRTDLAFVLLDGGWLHTCGASGAGKIRCWGYNGAGQIGRTDRVTGCPAEEQQFCTRIPEPIVGSR